MRKKEWKRKAKDLREALRLSEELAAMADERAQQYREDFDSLWDIVGEEPGDRNEHGVRSLAVVLERRMTELREWRYGELTTGLAMLRPTGAEISACCPGSSSDDDGIAALKRMLEPPTDFGPAGEPEPEARVCSGIAWDVCGRGAWYARDMDAATPCATMTGCVGRIGPISHGEVRDYAPGHTHPCGVMS